MHVALLGTGLIGAGMVEALRRHGEDVVVWNRTSSRARALEAVGARVAETPDAAVRGAARVHLVLTDDAAVDAVLAACAAAVASTAPIVDHSTVSPKGVLDRVARLGERCFVHAPVFMSPAMCREAKGIMLVSGATERFEAVRVALASMTGDLWYLGARPELAAAFKLFGNAMLLTITAGLADVFTMARALDIAPEDAHALFSRFKVAGTIDVRGKKMAHGDFTPSFELAMARKDLRLMLETTNALAVLPAVAARFDELLARGLGAQDVGVVAIDALSPTSP